MSQADPTAAARRFVEQYITSVAQLEMLLLLRTNPTEGWSAEQMARELRLETQWAEQQLQQLCEFGLAAPSGQSPTLFRFQPATPVLADSVTALSRAYLIHRVSIIETIYSKPSGSIRVFADAFRIKKEPPHP
jgi:hypothetical protein